MSGEPSLASRLDPEFVELMIRELMGQSSKGTATDSSSVQDSDEPPVPDFFEELTKTDAAARTTAPSPTVLLEDVPGAPAKVKEPKPSESPGPGKGSGKGSGRLNLVLRITEPDQPERIVRLGDASLVIGRGRDNPIVLQDARVSRQHVRIEPGEGCVVVEDLHSRNGTMLNDRFIQGQEAFPGDVIRIGRTIIRIEQE